MQRLREYVVEQIGIYETLLKLIDKEFNYEDIKEFCSDSDYHAFISALRRLG